jgi:hypothetical protein
MSFFPEFRIETRLGSLPTNKGAVFYYPKIKINNQWVGLDGTNQGKHITRAFVGNDSGWREVEMAERVINMFKSQVYI